MGIAQALLLASQLVQAGFELKLIVDKVHAKEKEGATPDQIASYLEGLADAALDKLKTA